MLKEKKGVGKIHIGPKIRRLRQIKGISQKAFASELQITQQAVSKIEQSEIVNEETLGKIAEILGVSMEAIVNFDDDASFNNFINTNEVINQRCDVTNHYQSIEKITELYERLLKSEIEKNQLLKDIADLKDNSNNRK
ncbi:helix-turn-helix domain-containing protein [Mucilaginibacter paludis]|uniref:Helix-turn-helix domain protein n=1 Tax=Mucilaginibacter paludis DSM 18603 TaxID=714943 RepID=H1Y3Z3_9SPHI|nr:helix-turn-helix transcriptional regulator [Mucilaginibacter paludis]EHQ30938.1 helix-turn-helix domain protein [Mucilaginibacter paludis DSM 18603]